MRLIAFLIMILALNLNIQAKEVPQFKNKVAIVGSAIMKPYKNGNLEVIEFSEFNEVLDKPITNIFFLDRISPYNTNELNYYLTRKSYNGDIVTNHGTYIIEDDLILLGGESIHGELDPNDPYDYNYLEAVAILVDYKKYGQKYLKNLMNKDLSMYSARYFEGKYVSEDGKSYLDLKRLSGNTFYLEGKTPNHTINVSGEDEKNRVELRPVDREIYVAFLDDENEYQYITIHLNILDNNTLIVFEKNVYKKLGFKGIYTKVQE